MNALVLAMVLTTASVGAQCTLRGHERGGVTVTRVGDRTIYDH